jgi:hypothetical protein
LPSVNSSAEAVQATMENRQLNYERRHLLDIEEQ